MYHSVSMFYFCFLYFPPAHSVAFSYKDNKSQWLSKLKGNQLADIHAIGLNQAPGYLPEGALLTRSSASSLIIDYRM